MRGFTFPLVLSLSLLAGLPARAAPPEAIEAGRGGLPRLLHAIPEGNLPAYGFADRQEAAGATLGEPFLLHLLGAEAVRSRALEPQTTQHWLFPVICDARPRTVLTVAYLDGTWQAIQIGGLSPAPEMIELARQWPAAQGYRLRYIEVWPGGLQLVEVARDALSDLVPLETTARALGLLGEGEPYDYPLYPASEIASALARVVAP